MKRNTIFFDLDGTLLGLDTNQYVQSFMQLMITTGDGEISKVLANQQVMRKAYKFVMNKEHKGMTNDAAFLFALYNITGIDQDRWQIFFENFSDTHFDPLKTMAKVEPLALQTVKVLKQKGYDLVLATNPVMHKKATLKRIEWSELDMQDFTYVTLMDNSCYCKPNPKYYREILDKTDKKAKQCYMVGNNVKEDLCTVALGFKAFLVTNYLIGDIKEAPRCEIGDYSKLLDWAKKLPKV